MRHLGQVAPQIAGRVAARLFTTPRRHPRTPREELRVEFAERSTVEHDGQRLAVYRWGEGPAVLLVHGWEGRGAQLGALIAPLRTAGFSVVTFDGPAHGASTGKTVTLAHFARAIVAVGRRVGPLAGVVAHSFGAPATTVALASGLEAERAVYFAPVATLGRVMHRFERFLALPEAAASAFRRALEARAGVPIDSLESETLAQRLDVPLLVIHDDDDRDVPATEGERLVRLWRGARMHRTHGLGHMRILENADTVKACVSFLVPAAAPLPLAALIDRELFRPDTRQLHP